MTLIDTLIIWIIGFIVGFLCKKHTFIFNININKKNEL